MSPGTDDVGGPKASEISELQKWNDPPEEIREEEDRLTGEELNRISEGGGKIQFPCDGQARPYEISKRIDAENFFSTRPEQDRPHCPQQSCSIHDQIPANDFLICMD